MQQLEDFVHASNVRRLLDRLGRGPDPVARATLHALLISEENKLGRTLEQLSNATRWLEEGKARIAEVQKIAETSHHGAEHQRQARDVLSTMQQTQVLLEQFHERLSTEVTRIEL